MTTKSYEAKVKNKDILKNKLDWIHFLLR